MTRNVRDEGVIRLYERGLRENRYVGVKGSDGNLEWVNGGANGNVGGLGDGRGDNGCWSVRGDVGSRDDFG